MLCLPWVPWTVCTVRYSKKISTVNRTNNTGTISFRCPIWQQKGDTFLDQCLMICFRQCNLRKPGVLIFCPWNPWRCRVITWQTFVCGLVQRFFQSAQLWSKFSQSFGFSPCLLPSNQPSNLQEIIHLQIRQQEKVVWTSFVKWNPKCYRKRASRLWS